MPYLPDMDSYGVIRFKTDRINELSTKNIFDPELGGLKEIAPPGTGHGFTSSRNGKIVPENAFADNEFYEMLLQIRVKKISLIRSCYYQEDSPG